MSISSSFHVFNKAKMYTPDDKPTAQKNPNKFLEMKNALSEVLKTQNLRPTRRSLTCAFETFFNNQSPQNKEKIKELFYRALAGASSFPQPGSSSSTTSEINLNPIFEFFKLAVQNRHQSTVGNYSLFSERKTKTARALEKIISPEETDKTKKTEKPQTEFHAGVIKAEMAALIKTGSFDKKDTKYLNDILAALLTQPNSSIHDIVSKVLPNNEFPTHSFLSFKDSRKLLYLCAQLMRSGVDQEILADLKTQYLTAIHILKNNPHSHITSYINEKKNDAALLLMKKHYGISEDHKSGTTQGSKTAEETAVTLDQMSAEFLFALRPLPDQKTKHKISKSEEKIQFAEKLADTTSDQKIKSKILRKKYTSSGQPYQVMTPRFLKQYKIANAKAHALLLQQNPDYFVDPADENECRTRDTRFTVNASIIKSVPRDDAKEVFGDTLANHFDQKEKNSVDGSFKTTCFRCGLAHSENAALAYVLKMLVENANQKNADGKIYLLDFRYLDMMGPSDHIGDGKRLAKHRRLVNKALQDITTALQNKQNKTAQIDALRVLFNTNDKKELLASSDFDADFNALFNDIDTLPTQIEFVSFDLGPRPEHSVTNAIGRSDNQTFRDLNFIYYFLKEKLTQPPAHISSLLKQLENIKDNPALYVSGHKTFHLDEILHRLCKEAGFVRSSGCYSNKDRGSNFYLFHKMVSKVLSTRAETDENKTQIKDFDFKTDEERQIAKNIFGQNEVFSVTLLNQGKGGSKCHRLTSWIKKLFGSDAEVAAQKKLQKSAKAAKN